MAICVVKGSQIRKRVCGNVSLMVRLGMYMCRKWTGVIKGMVVKKCSTEKDLVAFEYVLLVLRAVTTARRSLEDLTTIA